LAAATTLTLVVAAAFSQGWIRLPTREMPTPSTYDLPELRSPGAIPIGLVVDPARGRLFVVVRGPAQTPSIVTALDSRTGQILFSTEVGTAATALVLDQPRERLFVTTGGVETGAPASQRGRLTVLDARSGRVLSTSETGVNPTVITHDERRHLVLVVNQGAAAAPGSLSIFDDEANLRAELALELYPVAVAVDSQSGLGFVANFVSNTVTVVDVSGQRVVSTLSLGPAPGTLANVAFDEKTRLLLAMSFPPRFSKGQPSDGELRIIDTRTEQVLATLTLANPREMKLSVATGRVLVTSSADSESRLVALALPDGTVAWSRQLAEVPDAMSIDESVGRVFLISSNGATAMVIDARDGRTLCTRKIARGASVLAIDTQKHRAFVATSGGTLVAIEADC
jgi:DNA-binding beta-propeller fold protein YncE